MIKMIKKKKIVAVITLLCFMFTLMPTAAFAEWTEENGTYYVDMLNGAYTKGQLYSVLTTKWGTAQNTTTLKGYYYGGRTTNTTSATDDTSAGLTNGTSYTVYRTDSWLKQTEVGSFTARTYYVPTVTITDTSVEGEATVTEKVYHGGTATVTVPKKDGYVAKISNNAETRNANANAEGKLQATFEVNSKENAVFTVSYEIVPQGTIAVDVEGNGAVSVNGVELVESGSYDAGAGYRIAVTPGAEAYVTSFVVDGVEKIAEATLNTADRSYTVNNFTVVEKETHNVNVVFTQKVLAASNATVKYNPMKSNTEQLDDLKKEIFNKAVSVDSSMPKGLTYDQLTYEYKAMNENQFLSKVKYAWSALDAVPANDKGTTGYGDYAYKAFAVGGLNSTETIRLTWPGNNQYPEVVKEVTITLDDVREEATVDVSNVTSVEISGVPETDINTIKAAAANWVVKAGEVSVTNYTFDDDSFNIPSLNDIKAGKETKATATIIVPETSGYLETTKTVEIPVTAKEITYTVTINLTGTDLGCITGVQAGSVAEGSTFTLVVTPYNELTSDTDKNAYVKSVKIDGEDVTGKFNGTVFTANAAHTVNDDTVIDIEFDVRTLKVKEGPYNVGVNGGILKSQQIDSIEANIKDAVIDANNTLGYSADQTTVNLLHRKLIGEGSEYSDLGWAIAYFDDAIETVQLTLNATDKYPSVSVEGIRVNVVESRPSTEIKIVTDENNTVTHSVNAYNAIAISKDYVKNIFDVKVVNKNNNEEVFASEKANVAVTITDANGATVESISALGTYTVAFDYSAGSTYLGAEQVVATLVVADGRPATEISWDDTKTNISVTDKGMFANYNTEAEVLAAIGAVVKANDTAVATPSIINEIDLTNLTFGTYTIKLGYAANDSYQASAEKEVTVTFTDDRKATSLSINATTLDYAAYKDWTEANSVENIKTKMNITAVDADENPVTPVITVLNSANETASLPLGAGEYTVRVAFAENDTHKTATTVEAKLVLKAEPKASIVKVDTANIKVDIIAATGTSTAVQGTNGSIAPNTTATITVTAVGEYYLSGKVYINGVEGNTITTNADEITYIVTADVTEKATTAITTTADTKTVDESTFSDMKAEDIVALFGATVKGGTVDVTIVKVENTVGTYTVTFSYAGDGTHKAAADKEVTLIVRPATSITLGNTQASQDVTDVLARTAIPALFAPTVSANGTTITDAQVTVAEIKKADGTVVSGDITEAGKYTVTLAYATNDVYVGSVSAVATLTVNFATQINANANLDIPYNGNAITKQQIIDEIFASVTAGNTTVTTDPNKVSIDGAIYKRTESLDFLGGWTLVVGDTIGGSSWALGDVADTYKVTLKYNGEGNYLGTTEEIIFTVSEGRPATAIGWVDTKPAYDNRANIVSDFDTLSDVLNAVTGTIKVKDEVVTDVEPTITLITKGSEVYYSTGITVGSTNYGASAYVPLTDFGTYTVYLSFDGNNNYQAAAVATATLTIVDNRPVTTITVGDVAELTFAATEANMQQKVIDAVKAVTTITPAGVTAEYALDATTLPSAATGETKGVTVTITVADADTYTEATATKVVEVTKLPDEAKFVVDMTGTVITGDYKVSIGAHESDTSRVVEITTPENSTDYVAAIAVSVDDAEDNTVTVAFDAATQNYVLSNIEKGKTYNIKVTFAERKVVLKEEPEKVGLLLDRSIAEQLNDVKTAIINAAVKDHPVGYLPEQDDDYSDVTVKLYTDGCSAYPLIADKVEQAIEENIPVELLERFNISMEDILELIQQNELVKIPADEYALEEKLDLSNIQIPIPGVAALDLGVYYIADAILADAATATYALNAAEPTITVLIAYPAAVSDTTSYPAVSSDKIQLNIGDARTATTIACDTNEVTVTYGAYTVQDVLNMINPVVMADGNVVEDALVTFVKDVEGLNVGTHTVELSYAGNDTQYLSAKANVTIVVEKADATVKVNSATVRYNGNGQNVSNMITTAPSSDIDCIEFVVGLGLNDKGTADDVAVDTVVHINLPQLIDLGTLEKLGVDSSIVKGFEDKVNELLTGSKAIPLAELAGVLTGILESLEKVQGAAGNVGLDIPLNTDAITRLLNILNQVQQLEGIKGSNIVVSLTMDSDIIANTSGVYLIGAIVTDANYNTASNIGYLAITPDGTKVTLDFIINDENGLVTRPAILSGDYDLGSKVVEKEYADAEEYLHNIYIGVDLYGEPYVNNAPSANVGAYAQLSYIWDIGNEMYYAEPIARAYVVVADTVDVVFDNYTTELEGLPVYQFTYDRAAHGLTAGTDVKVVNKSGQEMPLADLTIRYIGIEGDAEIHNSTEPPTHAGVYTVIATYVANDQQYVGLGIATMVIAPSMEAEITVENEVYTYGDTVDIDSLITSTPSDAAYAILTAGIGVNSNDADNDALNNITGVVNIDFPAKLDKLFNEYNLFEDAYKDGIGVQTVINDLTRVTDKLVAAGYEVETITQVVEVLKQLNNATAVTFHDDVNPTDVGAYLVVASIFDPDYVPKVAAGLVVIAPNVTEATLYWTMPDANGIVTVPVIANGTYKLDAYSDVEEVTNDIQYLVLSVTAKGKVNLQNLSDTELNAAMDESGVYTELAYFIDGIESSMYYAKPIMRNLLVVPNAVDITFEDANDNDIRHFSYDGNPHGMTVASIADQSGNEIAKDRWADSLTITYVGANLSEGVHYGTNAPVHAGQYTAIATYVERDAEGTVQYAGMKLGTIIIAPSVTADVDVASKVVVYNEGNAQPVNVADMVTSTPADAKVTILTAGIDVSGDFSADGLDALTGVINIDFPAKADKVLKVLVPSAYAEGISVERTVDALQEIATKVAEFTDAEIDGLNYLIDVLQRADRATAVTFYDQKDANPTNIGTYLVVAAVCDPDYIPTMGVGILSVIPSLDRMELHWNMNDANGIITLPIVDEFDFAAYAENSKDAVAINYLVSGVNVQDKVVLAKATANELNGVFDSKGVYTQMAYVPASEIVDASIPVVAPIMRTFAVVENHVAVTLVDANGNNAFVFGYDGNAKAVDAVVTDLAGNAYDTSNGVLTVTYIGVGKDVALYHSTNAPSTIGAYNIVATYVETVNGEVSCVGMTIGAMVIEPGDNGFAISDTTVHYDGNVQFVEVLNPADTAYIYTVVNEDEKTINIVLTERVTSLLKDVKDLTNVTIDQAKEIVAEVKAQIAAGEVDAEAVAVVGAFAKAIDEVLSKADTNYTVMFNQSNPVEPGIYEVYALSYAANLKPVFDYATLMIEDHTAGEAVVENEVEPTCKVAGSYESVVKCTVCGDELSRTTVEVPATGNHTEGEAVKENETSDGYDLVVYCTVCTAELSRTHVTDQEICYTVSFDSDGGSTVESLIVAEGASVVKPEDPIRPGYTFNGWTLNGVAYDFTTAVTANITLVATWTPDTVPTPEVTTSSIIVYYLNEDDVAIKDTIVEEITTRGSYDFDIPATILYGGKTYEYNTVVDKDETDAYYDYVVGDRLFVDVDVMPTTNSALEFILKYRAITVESIEVYSTAHKTDYNVGEALDLTGLTILVTYSDGSTATIPVTAGMVSGFDTTTTGNKTVTITYEGKTTTFAITVTAVVVDAEVEFIAVNSTTYKTEYKVGDALDLTGLTILVTYSDSSTATIPVTAGMVSGFDTTTTGNKTVTITYEGKTTTFVIHVTSSGSGSGTGGSGSSGGAGGGGGFGGGGGSSIATEHSHNAFIGGYPDGTFGPDKQITRGEVAAIFARLLADQKVPGKVYTNNFSDVPSTLWSAESISFMQSLGMLGGYPDGTFRPEQPITRAELVAIVCRFKAVTPGVPIFNDVPMAHWAIADISAAAAKKWVGGYEDGSFRPERPITRAEVVSILCRVLERNADVGHITSNYATFANTFSDVRMSHWAYWNIMEAAIAHDCKVMGNEETWKAVKK